MAPTSAVLLLAMATLLLSALALTRKKESVYYVELEHINLTYWNPKYYKFLKVSTVRYSRKDPNYYLNMHGEFLVTFGNNITVDAYIYEFLSNEYRRSFVEIHLGFCDLFIKDKVFSPFLNKFFAKCPVPPGPFVFENVTLPNHPVLKTFPFTKGRFYGSATDRGAGERLFDVYVDAAIKQRWLKN